MSMGQWIHYEADIFFLMDSISLLQRNLSLEIDAAYFAEKVLGDLRFIDHQLTGLFKAVQTSDYLLDKNRYIRYLYKAKLSFAALAQEVAKGDLGSQIGLYPQRDEFRKMEQRQREEAEFLLESTEVKTVEEEDLFSKISQEEFKFLFMESQEA